MKIRKLIYATGAMLVAAASAQTPPSNFVLVDGGSAKAADDVAARAVPAAFYIGKYEVTQKEWTDVMGSTPSQFKGDDLPVENVTWYDCVAYCNRRSEKEGLRPFYNIDKAHKDPANNCDLDDIKWTVITNPGANGYRLPTEAEWQYAAGGGPNRKGYIYSGGNDPDKVAWYWLNSGDVRLNGNWKWSRLEANHCRTHPVGSKEPNELGLYDMSGNVREWCQEWYVDRDIKAGMVRVQKGGGWIGDVTCCEITGRGGFEANGKGPDQGLRLCRNK